MEGSLLIDWGIPLLIGIWAALAGFGVVNKNWFLPKKREKFQRFFRIMGIALIAYSLLAIISISYKEKVQPTATNPEIIQ